jgi:hypothetical protein
MHVLYVRTYIYCTRMGGMYTYMHVCTRMCVHTDTGGMYTYTDIRTKTCAYVEDEIISNVECKYGMYICTRVECIYVHIRTYRQKHVHV